MNSDFILTREGDNCGRNLISLLQTTAGIGRIVVYNLERAVDLDYVTVQFDAETGTIISFTSMRADT